MKIEIEVPDIKTAVDTINNAAIAYGDIVWSAILGCEVPRKFQPLTKLSEEELIKRLDCLKSIYKQLEEIEKNI